jgi:protein TonB
VNPASIAPPAIRGELPIPVEAPITGIQTNHTILETMAGPTAVGGQVQAARLLKSVPPVYPAIARSNHQNGDVTLDALIDASGNITEVSVISGPALLRKAAIEAVRQWKYEPAQLDGRAVPMHLRVTVKFRIG